MAVNVRRSKDPDLLERAQCPLGNKRAAVADFYFYYTGEAKSAGLWECEL